MPRVFLLSTQQHLNLFASFHLRSFSTSSVLSKKKAKMPPKKQVVEKKVLFGRPGNNLNAGIVGLPNVGKSTFFQAITRCSLGTPANYPYATIDPEESRVVVPDERYDWLCDYYKPKSKVHAFLTIYDIAGLAKGASTGAGLGNAFLSHVRNVDLIFQMVRCFDDADIIHTEGDVDPIRDLEIIQEELRIKDIEWVEKHIEGLRKLTLRGGQQSLEVKQKIIELEVCERVKKLMVEDKKDVRKGVWNNKEIEIINGLILLSAKPIVYLANLSEKDYIRQKNKWLAKVKGWIDENSPGDVLLPVSSTFEHELSLLEDDEVQKRLDELKAKSSIPRIVHQGYKSLELIYYFTAGEDEVRAWTVRKGIKAPQAAGVIHTDFEKTFVCGEIMKFDDLKEAGSEAQTKANGKYNTKGKDYEIQDGDICYWKTGAGKSR